MLGNTLWPLLVFSSGLPTLLPFFSVVDIPQAFIVNCENSSYFCQSHEFQTWRVQSFTSSPDLIPVNLLPQFHSTLSVVKSPSVCLSVRSPQSDAAETVSHSSHLLNLLHHLPSLCLHLLTLDLSDTDTCCPKCKCWYLFVGQTLT